ncbi:hypothetical protein DHD05_14615 [Arenibacter sp. N53]|nr:hypothetical protein [Arenibacter sp. N53]
MFAGATFKIDPFKCSDNLRDFQPMAGQASGLYYFKTIDHKKSPSFLKSFSLSTGHSAALRINSETSRPWRDRLLVSPVSKPSTTKKAPHF